MTDAAFALDSAGDRAQAARLARPFRVDLTAQVSAAAAAGARGLRLWSDILSLSRGPGCLTTAEYFYYRLYDAAFTPAEKRAFVGRRVQNTFHNACNRQGWFASVNDKLLFHAILRECGLPTPEVRAAYGLGERLAPGKTLKDRDALAAFLRSPEGADCVAKPVDGMFGLGVFAIERVEGHQLVMRDGATASMDDLAQYFEEFGSWGYLFQERLAPHAELANAFGPALGTVRMLVLKPEDAAPEIVSALYKIAPGEGVADNYWREGGAIAPVDLSSGALGAGVSGSGAEMARFDTLPRNGAVVRGRVLPDWDAAKAVCLEGARAFPGVRTQSWDIALTDQGPQLLETNFGGDLHLHQLAHNRGLIDERLRAHGALHGYAFKK